MTRTYYFKNGILYDPLEYKAGLTNIDLTSESVIMPIVYLSIFFVIIGLYVNGQGDIAMALIGAVLGYLSVKSVLEGVKQ